MTEPIFHAALELARPEVRGIRVRLLGVTASNLGEREQLGALRPATTRGTERAIEAADALRRRYGERRRDAGALWGRGCPRRSNATRATRSTGGRGACRSRARSRIRTRLRIVTAKVTRTLDDIPPDDA